MGAASAARRVSIGVDFGTESGRVLALDLGSGEEIAVAEVVYPHGVIEAALPDSDVRLGPDVALQDPGDYLDVLYQGVPAVLADGSVAPDEVVGVGVDFTSCTVLPVSAEGTPLCRLEQWRRDPHAFVKLWKHHAAQPIADRLNEVAAERGETFLDRYGGRLSSEWYFPKLIEVWRDDRPLYEAMNAFVEATDWVVWQLTGNLSRSSCPAGYKACWSEEEGLPSRAFFEAAYPGFPDPWEKLGRSFVPLGSRAGTLSPEMVARLGLRPGLAVATGNVDSFVSLPGAGIREPGVFVTVVGTSICDLVVDRKEVRMPGITGVVADGILPGYFGYEAGQAAVGDMFAWFGRQLLSGGAREGDWHAVLEPEAAALSPGESGLVALDWWNGNRSVLGDADLSGVIAGLTLSTTRAELYRALLESVAFGARRIIENFTANGIELREIVACGGIAERNSLLMQILSDACGLAVTVAGSRQVPARGAALFGALAAGAEGGGFDEVGIAVSELAPDPARRYVPDRRNSATYDELYSVVGSLHDELGRDRVEWLHHLKRIRLAAVGSRGDEGGDDSGRRERRPR